MKLWNVHRTTLGKLESLLNDHEAKGYSVHHVRGVGNNNKEHLAVVFVREFGSAQEREAFLRERAMREGAKDVPVAEPVPA